MMQLEYCKECHEVFELSQSLGSTQTLIGMHKLTCSKK